MDENQNVKMNLDKEVTNIPVSHETQDKTEYKNVSVNLLTNIKSILEISTARGTFKANELTSVGQVYDQLLILLK